MSAAEDLPRVWFDVEDLFHFAIRNARPTGIQRVCFEIYQAAMADPAMAGRIGFLRHATTERGFVETQWSELEILFRGVTERGPPEPARGKAQPVPTMTPRPTVAGLVAPRLPPEAAAAARLEAWRQHRSARWLSRSAGFVPERMRQPAVLFTVMQARAIAALSGAATATAAAVARRGRRAGGRRLVRLKALLPQQADAGGIGRGGAGETGVARRLPDIARRGDVLAVFGSPWFEQDYSELAAHACGRLGMRLAVLVHDVIPVRRPEWVDRGTTRVYRNWYTSVLPLADTVFANSRATADDVTAWCRRDNVVLRGPVQPLPLGTGFGVAPVGRPSIAAAAAEPPPLSARGLPAALAAALGGRPYVLFVSTIEARKNHMLLFRVWRRLLEEMGPGRVPDLVFAGKVGWMVSDLMQQIENSRSLDGRLHVVEGLDDSELRALYAGCLFTVFPSLYEGWGLPVSESLAMGKPCVTSNATSLPEAGGAMARYFDPTNLNDACRLIRATIEDDAGLAAWQQDVQRSFRPVSWGETASAVLAGLDRSA